MGFEMIPAVPPKPPARVKPVKVLDIRKVALRDLPRGGVVVCCCTHCNLEREENLTQLISGGRFGGHTLEQIEEVLVCRRKGCCGTLNLRFEAC
jgi:hypothetical protein